MKKPIFVLLVQITMVYLAIIYTLNGVSAALLWLLGRGTLTQGLAGFLILTSVGVVAIWVLVRIHRRTLRKKWLLVFLWAVFFVFPLTNVLAANDWFYRVQLRPDERFGASLVDLGHFVWFLVLIIWLHWSKRSGPYMWRAPDEAVTTNPPVPAA